MDNSRNWASTKYAEGGEVTASDPQYGSISYHNEPTDPPRYAGGGLAKKAAKNLSKFMEGSKVVDKAGKPMPVYHGGMSDIQEFDPIAYFGHKNVANQFADPEYRYGSSQLMEGEAPNVIPAYLNMRNPKVFTKESDYEKHVMEGGLDAEKWKKKGYDGVIYAPNGDLSHPDTYFVSFDPKQIKSAVGNRGTYDPNEADITKAGGGLLKKAAKATKQALEKEFKRLNAGDVVSGNTVREDIPNTSSIGASLYDYKVDGVQEVPMSVFEIEGKPKYRSPEERNYTLDLANQIKQNKELNPLIVVKDKKGYYILEGAHRFDALRELDTPSFPALVVHDLESLGDKGYAGGGLARKVLKGAVEKAVKEKKPALPLDLTRAKPKTAQEITKIADRVARQQSGEFVRKSEISGKPSDTANLAGRSGKEVERLKDLDYTLERTKDIRPTPTYESKVGDVNIAIPGDQTIADYRLVDVNGRPIDSTQQGGSMYGEGKLDLEDPLFWASEEGIAQILQDKITELAKLYNTDRVTAYHLAMGQDANNFAMHFADANLKAIANSDLSPEAIEIFNAAVREGPPHPKTGKKIPMPHFAGIENPEEAYMQMLENPMLRKWFNNRMKVDKYTTKVGLPSGKDIQWAITEPALRNMEINLTGHSVGRMKPFAELTDTADHVTYGKGIQGESLGRAPELSPFEMSFPDADLYLRSVYAPSDLTGTMQKVFPHQVVDQQQLDQMSEYYRRLREIRGFKDGGEVEEHAGGGLIKKVAKKVLESKGKYGAERVEKAADLVPNLEKQYDEHALYRAFIGDGDNAAGLMVISPRSFESYSAPLWDEYVEPQYIRELAQIARQKGFKDVPYLMLGRKESEYLPRELQELYIAGHEGRHRTRALDKLGDESTLIRMIPRSSMREHLPRRSQEEYIDALNKELGLYPLVRPEQDTEEIRSLVRLPKVFAKGGSANLDEEFKKADTIEKKPLRAIPQAVIRALDKGRNLSPAEAKIAGSYADPENQWKLGSILEEFDPVFTAGRGAEALKNVDYGAIRDLALQRYQLAKNPRKSIEKGVENLGEAAFGALDVAPAVGAVASKTGRNLIKNLVKEFEGAPVGLSIEDVTPKSVNFVSSVERAIKGHKMESMNGEQWANWMRANASKSAKKEAEATGLYDWLKSQGKVSKADIEAYVEGNLPQIEPVVRSGPKATYATYTEPGGRNYREIVYGLKKKPSEVTMPEGFKVTEVTYPETGETGFYAETPSTRSAFFKTREEAENQLQRYAENVAKSDDTSKTYTSGHYRDVDNPLLHMRVKDRETPEGKRVHFLEELQSDWAQKARKSGIKQDVTDDMLREYHESVRKETDPSWEDLPSKDKAFLRHILENRQIDAVPPAPYIGDTADWTKLGLKRALKDAIEGGHDYLAWTTGQQQADRYSLSKYLENVRAVKTPEGTYSFYAYEKGADRGNLPSIAQHNLTEDELADHLGKEMAQKIVNDLAEAKPTQIANYDNIDLQLGGEGMKGYYDKIMPQAMNDILKQYGITDGVKPVKVQYANKIYYDDRVDDINDLLERGQLTPHQRQMIEVFQDDIESAKKRGEDPWRLESSFAKWIAEQNRAPDTITEHMGIEITPELKEKILNEGLPHFNDGGEVSSMSGRDAIKRLVDEFSS